MVFLRKTKPVEHERFLRRRRYEIYCYLRAVILSGKELSDNIKAQLAEQVATFLPNTAECRIWLWFW